MSWKEVDYQLSDLNHPDVLRLVDVLETLYVNGDVILRSFEPIDPDLYDKARVSDLQGTDYVIKTFLRSPKVMATLGDDIQMTEDDVENFQYVWQSVFEFEGSLNHMLALGGAYKSGFHIEDYIREVSRNFVNAIVPDGFLNTTVYRCSSAWTNWFYDIAWDRTFIIKNPVEKKWILLCTTDTD